jgi:hypothetical protein
MEMETDSEEEEDGEISKLEEREERDRQLYGQPTALGDTVTWNATEVVGPQYSPSQDCAVEGPDISGKTRCKWLPSVRSANITQTDRLHRSTRYLHALLSNDRHSLLLPPPQHHPAPPPFGTLYFTPAYAPFVML